MQFSILNQLPDEMESEWNLLLDRTACHVPFLRYEYLQVWWETRGGGEWPEGSTLQLVTAHRDGTLVAAAPLFHTPDHMGKPALLLVGSIEISDYLDLLCPPEDLPDFSLGLLQTLKSASIPAWDTFDLYNILDGSPSLPALQAAAEQIGWQSQLERLQHSPYIPLPDEWEKYLAGIDKKQRHEIRRKIRRAEESGRDVHLRIIQENAELEQNIDAFMDLMAFDEEKAKFLTPMMKDHIRLAAKCAFEKECLNLAFLEVDGQNAAGYLSFDYLNRLWVYNSGLNPAFRELSPGWVLLGYLIRWAIEQNFIELDFMRGDEDYKYRFGGQDRFVMRLTLTP